MHIHLAHNCFLIADTERQWNQKLCSANESLLPQQDLHAGELCGSKQQGCIIFRDPVSNRARSRGQQMQSFTYNKDSAQLLLPAASGYAYVHVRDQRNSVVVFLNHCSNKHHQQGIAPVAVGRHSQLCNLQVSQNRQATLWVPSLTHVASQRLSCALHCLTGMTGSFMGRLALVAIQCGDCCYSSVDALWSCAASCRRSFCRRIIPRAQQAVKASAPATQYSYCINHCCCC